MNLDIERCRRGMKQLDVVGIPRSSLIEEAIKAIQLDPLVPRLRKCYFGIKNYASFGDQREDHEYGMGPKHGTIVFSIGLPDQFRRKSLPLDTDAIYYLEAYRDFGSLNWQMDDGKYAQVNLNRAVQMFDMFTARRNKLADAFERQIIVEHQAVVKDEKVSA